MKNNKKNVVYAFIDSQNLNLGVRNLGWQLDFKKFRIYLEDKYKVEKAFLFIGFIKGNEALYRLLKNYGYELVFKPTVKYNNRETKGNVDAELVLHSVKIQYRFYNKAIIVSGDGDFYCLHAELVKENKLLKLIVPSRKSESSLLHRFREYKLYVEGIRNKVERKR
ncbi:MAG: hypothetical protein US52_C0057G0007 [candidate division WS6 bacterium GW2011_GWA2_37_6]|uniref:NYN domain-containing protein n=1 Tax=candidate division WS6 bacterium GW2011_GWA2_37_6 TaxID=1619087 RepID=A0A0G0K1F8_9BACT|nr:MAG: hypothetical protein US52_C0057G0007 [candidate division WS6 bacterium GW2011_GWA2_37_6]